MRALQAKFKRDSYRYVFINVSNIGNKAIDTWLCSTVISGKKASILIKRKELQKEDKED